MNQKFILLALCVLVNYGAAFKFDYQEIIEKHFKDLIDSFFAGHDGFKKEIQGFVNNCTSGKSAMPSEIASNPDPFLNILKDKINCVKENIKPGISTYLSSILFNQGNENGVKNSSKMICDAFKNQKYSCYKDLDDFLGWCNEDISSFAAGLRAGREFIFDFLCNDQTNSTTGNFLTEILAENGLYCLFTIAEPMTKCFDIVDREFHICSSLTHIPKCFEQSIVTKKCPRAVAAGIEFLKKFEKNIECIYPDNLYFMDFLQHQVREQLGQAAKLFKSLINFQGIPDLKDPEGMIIHAHVEARK